MNQLEIIYSKKLECAPLFSSKCGCCHKKFGKGFLYHHVNYYENGVVYSDKEYHEKIYDEIKAKPQDFMLLCTKCHYILEMLKRMNKERFNRIVRAVRRSR